TRYFEHFVLIAEALNELHLWNEEDKFYYDTLCRPNAEPIQLRIQSIVGLSPLFAVSIIDKKALEKLDDFTKRITWFENFRKANGKFWPNEEKAETDEILLSLLPKDRLEALLQRLLNEAEFLSEGGIRALSKYHEANPYTVTLEGNDYTIQYDPGDSTSSMFGGNSNWRGPVWIPINYLIIKSLQKFGEFYGDKLVLEYPVGSGNKMPLKQAVRHVTERVVSLFLPDEKGGRKLHAEYNEFYTRPGNEHLVLFYEYFNGDSGRGLGASHQTGWTALVANLLNDLSSGVRKPKTITEIEDDFDGISYPV
nr:glucosidase [Chitinophagaceae bacterium]